MQKKMTQANKQEQIKMIVDFAVKDAIEKNKILTDMNIIPKMHRAIKKNGLQVNMFSDQEQSEIIQAILDKMDEELFLSNDQLAFSSNNEEGLL